MVKNMNFFLKKEFLSITLTLIVKILIILLVYFLLKKIIKNIFLARKIDKKKKATIVSLFNNIVKYTLIIFCALFILDAFGIETKAIVASLGVAGLVIGLSLQDIIKDFIAGMFIILENQYGVGDYVTIGNFKGKVISLGLKTTKVESYTGEIKTIPNRYVDQAINHSLKNQVLIIDIPVTNEYDISNTKKILEEVCTKLTKELKNIRSEVKLIGVNSMTHLLIEYRIKVEVLPLEEALVRDQILSNVRNALVKHKENLISVGKEK